MRTQPKIVRNAVHCHVCDTVVESTYTHDLRYCECPSGSASSVFVDGGLSYLRRGFGNEANFTDLAETSASGVALGSGSEQEDTSVFDGHDEVSRLRDENEALRWLASNERGMAERFADALLSGPFRGGRMKRRERMYGSEWAGVHQVLDDWENRQP